MLNNILKHPMDGQGGAKQALHITIARNNVTYTGTIILSEFTHHNVSQHNSTAEDYDQTGASYYVIAVVLVYGMSIVMLIASHIKRRHDKVLEDKQIDKYLQDFQIVREKYDRDVYRSLKKNIMRKINWDRGKKETVTTLQNSILPMLAVAMPGRKRRESVSSRGSGSQGSRLGSRAPSIELPVPSKGRTRKKGFVNLGSPDIESVNERLERMSREDIGSRSDLDSNCTESTEKKVRFSMPSSDEEDYVVDIDFSGAVGVEANKLRQQLEKQRLLASESDDVEDVGAESEFCQVRSIGDAVVPEEVGANAVKSDTATKRVELEVIIDGGYDDDMDSSNSHASSDHRSPPDNVPANQAALLGATGPGPSAPQVPRGTCAHKEKWEAFNPGSDQRLSCEFCRSGKGRSDLSGEVVWIDQPPTSPDSGCATPDKDYLTPQTGGYLPSRSITPSPASSPGHSPQLPERRQLLRPLLRPDPNRHAKENGRTSPRSSMSLGTIITRTLTNPGYASSPAPTPKFPPSPRYMYSPRASRSRSPSPRPPPSVRREPSPQPPTSPQSEKMLQITCL